MTTKQIEKRRETLETLRGTVEDALDTYQCELESLRDDMQSYADDRSDTWSDGDKGAAWMEFIEGLESCIDSVDDVLEEVPSVSW